MIGGLLLLALVVFGLGLLAVAERFARRAFLMRVPLAVLGVCILLPLAALLTGQPTLVGVFAQNSPLQVAGVVFAGGWCIVSARRSGRMIARAGQLRYPTSFVLPEISDSAFGIQSPRIGRWNRRRRRALEDWCPFDLWDHLQTAAYLLPLVIAVISLSLSHRAEGVVSGFSFASVLGAALGGYFASVLWTVLLDRIHGAVLGLDAESFVRFVSSRSPAFRIGYVRDGQLLPGHLYNSSALVLLIVTFKLCSLLDPGGLGGDIPALVYLSLLGVFLVVLLSGATFFCDRLRLPLIFVVAASATVSFRLWNVEHYFLVEPLAPGGEVAMELVPAREALEQRLVHGAGSSAGNGAPARQLQRKAVIVCAAGGGIQAAGWTVECLGQLDALTGGAFTRRTVCVSGVSGGSVGLGYFFEAQRRFGPGLDPDQRRIVWEAATHSSLNAAFWGWVIKDIPRSIPFLFPEPYDRGLALEQAWIAALRPLSGSAGNARGFEASLLEWSASARSGNLPAVFFNATGLTSGQRYIFTNIDGDLAARNVLLTYGGDAAVVTAMRMSATFPFVTPMARAGQRSNRAGGMGRTIRPLELAGEEVEHLADGGYYDNLGVVTALEWLESVGEVLAAAGIEEIALVSVIPFPADTGESSAVGRVGTQGEFGGLIPARVARSLRASFFGPALLIAQVRVSSQVERSAFEQALRRKSKDGPTLRSFVLRPSLNDHARPLTWHLTERQKAEIKQDWVDLTAREEFAELLAWLE